MIIRRRHTTNFTTIGNALFEDERLAADEVGILAYLLSRPHDWEVRRPALMRRWKVGREAIKRILASMIRTGWCQAQRTRLANGTFHVIYEIRDQPGATLTEDKVRQALSLVSSEAIPEDSAENTSAGVVPGTDPPHTGQPYLVDQPTASRSAPIKTLQNTDLPRKNPPTGGRNFAVLLAAWPIDKVLSRVRAERAFAHLTDSQARGCEDYVGDYLRDCSQENRKVCDLTTYVMELRWERLQVHAAASSATVERLDGKHFVIEGTRAWAAWNDHLRQTRGRGMNFSHRGEGKDAGKTGRWLPSLFPPGHDSTAPPQNATMTADDEKYLAETGLR